ncbi:MAG: DNA repair protein RecO [Lachnospiraceae bacterium]|nr:DNA repair protein RecO [Lachnospiraceae bacterium]
MAGGFVELNGIVLSSSNLGDYDKRIVVLTKEKGKAVIFAKGARKMNSPLTAACQTFAFGTFKVYEGKNYNLNEASIKDYFVELREDIEGLYRGFYFCEMVEHFTVEGSQDVDILNLLYVALTALRKKQMRASLIQIAFEMRIMASFGLGMEVSSCLLCGKEETEKEHNLVRFSSSKGGMLCADCAKEAGYTLPVSSSSLYAMQYILSAPLSRLFGFDLKSENEMELAKISKDYIKTQVNHKFKSLDFIT